MGALPLARLAHLAQTSWSDRRHQVAHSGCLFGGACGRWFARDLPNMSRAAARSAMEALGSAAQPRAALGSNALAAPTRCNRL